MGIVPGETAKSRPRVGKAQMDLRWESSQTRLGMGQQGRNQPAGVLSGTTEHHPQRWGRLQVLQGAEAM